MRHIINWQKDTEIHLHRQQYLLNQLSKHIMITQYCRLWLETNMQLFIFIESPYHNRAYDSAKANNQLHFVQYQRSILSRLNTKI